MLTTTELAARLANLNLATARLQLRPISAADAEVQIAHESHPAIMRTIRDPLPRTEVEQKARELGAPWQAHEGSWVGLSLVQTATREVIGFFFLRVVSHENQCVELGYRLHPDHWGQGYGHEAAQSLMIFFDEVLRVRKVVAYCIADNGASAGLLEKLGFVKEGCLFKHSPLGGKWHDELAYGRVLAPDREVPAAASWDDDGSQ